MFVINETFYNDPSDKNNADSAFGSNNKNYICEWCLVTNNLPIGSYGGDDNRLMTGLVSETDITSFQYNGPYRVFPGFYVNNFGPGRTLFYYDNINQKLHYKNGNNARVFITIM